MEKTSPRLSYDIPYLAELVNSFPRFDLSLRRVNVTFLPNSHDYKEVMSFYCSMHATMSVRLSVCLSVCQKVMKYFILYIWHLSVLPSCG